MIFLEKYQIWAAFYQPEISCEQPMAICHVIQTIIISLGPSPNSRDEKMHSTTPAVNIIVHQLIVIRLHHHFNKNMILHSKSNAIPLIKEYVLYVLPSLFCLFYFRPNESMF